MLMPSCTAASIAWLTTQSFGPVGLPPIHTEKVLILEPCPVKIVGYVDSTRPEQMNSIFFERAWVRVKAMRKWIVLG